MYRFFTTVLLATTVFFLIEATSRGNSAADSFAKGEKLLTQGNFDTALAAYAAAVRADRGNQTYMQHYALLRRVIQLRKILNAEKEPTRWEKIARSLHSFYVSEKVYSEALALGRQIHAKLNNEWSAVTLAETQLALELNNEAVATLAGLTPEKSSAMSKALEGIALARDGRPDRTKEIANAFSLPEDADSRTIYAAARLFAAVGDSTKSLKLLTRSLESTPPSRQGGFRDHAKTCPEFSVMASTPEFAKTLDTKSKIPESKCSGGKSCAGCPMRGKCPSSQGH